MNRYIALLRGINRSGKNKISMSELKKGFAELGFTEVTTYLNSGNVIFSSTVQDIKILTNKIQFMITDIFDMATLLTGGETIIKNDMIILYFSCLLFLMRRSMMKSAILKPGTRTCITITVLFSGPLAGTIIKKRIGGLRLPAQALAAELQYEPQIR